MKKDNCDHLLAVMESCFTQMHLDFNTGLRQFRVDLDKIASVFGGVRNRRSLESHLRRLPDLHAEEVAQISALLRLLPWLLKEATEHFPDDPGGRNRRLSDEKRTIAQRDIQDAISGGKSITQAVREVAKLHDVSERSMWKCWGASPKTIEYHEREIIERVRAGAMTLLDSAQPREPNQSQLKKS